MEKTIWKFELETKDNQIVKMPINAKILTIQTQFDKPCLWALVDPNADKEDRFIKTFGTGHSVKYNKCSPMLGAEELDEFIKYIGTYQLHNGSLVFHAFEKNLAT